MNRRCSPEPRVEQDDDLIHRGRLPGEDKRARVAVIVEQLFCKGRIGPDEELVGKNEIWVIGIGSGIVAPVLMEGTNGADDAVSESRSGARFVHVYPHNVG